MSDLNLKCPADFQGGIQDDWDNDYASMWAQVQSLSHNKMQYRKAWMAAKDENARLQSEVERLRGRCEELEADHQYAKGTLLCPKWAKAQVTRKQADALLDASNAMSDSFDLPSGNYEEEKAVIRCQQFVCEQAQKLYAQAAEIEGGEA